MQTLDDLREQNPRAYLAHMLADMMETTRWEWQPEAREKFMDALDRYIEVKIGERMRA